MIPQGFYNIDNIPIEDAEKRWQYLSIQLKSYFDILNKGLVFPDNFRSRTIGAEFTAANVDTIFQHGLGFTPSGYIPIGYTAAMRVYNGDGAWNNDIIVLKSDAVGTATILVF